MTRFMRVFFIVLDGCGVGELPDADLYGDSGSATLPHMAEAVGGLILPHLNRLGLGKIAAIPGLDNDVSSQAAFGKMAEASAGKDSTSGHWEHFGVVLKAPLPLYPEGFPKEIITVFENRCGHNIIGNEPAS
ncbi:MAG: phosphopentomutase, partial [FCB group bacterium]|nr:phosphopentomutase [FCB group bacterium]